MMKNIIIITVTLMLAACASAMSVQGNDFTDNDVDGIVKNSTTIDEVRATFGEPTTIIRGASETIVWSYIYVNSATEINNVFSMKMDVAVQSKALKVTFQNGTVVDYEYTNSSTSSAVKTDVY